MCLLLSFHTGPQAPPVSSHAHDKALQTMHSCSIRTADAWSFQLKFGITRSRLARAQVTQQAICCHLSNLSISAKSSLRTLAWTLPSFIAPSGRYHTFLLCAVSSCTKVPLGLASRFHSAFFHTCIALAIT